MRLLSGSSYSPDWKARYRTSWPQAGVGWLEPDNNPDNFLSILAAVAHYYPVLQEHLGKPFRKDVTYLSPTFQNEMIGIIGKNIIQATL